MKLAPKMKAICGSVAFDDQSAIGAAEEFFTSFGDDEAFGISSDNQVETIVAHRLLMSERIRLSPNSRWISSHSENHTRLSAYLQELDRIADELNHQGIRLLALKNGGIARGIYSCPGCCPMGDLDTLIERRHFRQAHEILLRNGYTFKFRSALEVEDLDQAEASGGGEYWKLLPNGEKFWLELQWRPVAGRWIRPDQEPSAEELMTRSVPIPGTAVRLLAPEDNLLQVCLHTAKHSYVRAPGFRLHLDVERIVHGQIVDWQVFLERVEKLQVKTAVYFSLAIPKELFDTPIPEAVLARLRPSAWKDRLISRMIARAGLFNPNERKFSRVGYIFFNILLYDDLGGLLRSVFPSGEWMRKRYSIRQGWQYPYYYARRLVDLALRRENT